MDKVIAEDLGINLEDFEWSGSVSDYTFHVITEALDKRIRQGEFILRGEAVPHYSRFAVVNNTYYSNKTGNYYTLLYHVRTHDSPEDLDCQFTFFETSLDKLYKLNLTN
ncbi:hypothetical protein 015DV004_122 [Bacillus phage 015DV004]|nr:hypothetical protein 015DV004_122 [Bacillus phage 015DV004]